MISLAKGATSLLVLSLVLSCTSASFSSVLWHPLVAGPTTLMKMGKTVMQSIQESILRCAVEMAMKGAEALCYNEKLQECRGFGALSPCKEVLGPLSAEEDWKCKLNRGVIEFFLNTLTN